ncbi:MAG: transglutaminase family protein [Planctomycetota bacterium]|nr:MAG: transglutaminase family protein [Planctomycetota bacterium]
MQYKITHTTTYQYADPVSVCHSRVMMTPRNDSRTRCESHRIKIQPTPQVVERREDYFGNLVHCFSIEESHRQLKVTATSRVTVEALQLPPLPETPPWETIRDAVANAADADWFPASLTTFDSPRVLRDAPFAEYAAESFSPARPIVEAAAELTERINHDFTYDTTATTVATPTDEAFQMRKGVCQDFAHVQIACLRSLGLPARYVSGYLRTIPPPGEPRKIGADESHAWLSIFCGSEIGWVDVDPTNNCICTTDHVPSAWGRDYGDVTPLKGVFLGGGQHELTVSVDVEPLE